MNIIIATIALALLARSVLASTLTKPSWSFYNAIAVQMELSCARFTMDYSNAGIDDIDQNGMTFLHRAVVLRSIEMVKFFADNHGNLNLANGKGQTALMMAVELGYPEIFNKLIEYKADIDAKDSNGKTVLMMTIEFNQMGMFKVVIQSEHSIHAEDSLGRTPFLVAVEYNRPEMAALLMEKGATLNVRDKQERTACIIAAEKKNYDILLWLVKMDADLSLENVQGTTSLELVAKERRLDVFSRLLEQEASLELKNSSRKAPHTLMDPRNVDFFMKLASHEYRFMFLNALTNLFMLATQLDRFDVVDRLAYVYNFECVEERAGAALSIIISDYHQLGLFKFLAKYNVKVDLPADSDECAIYRWIMPIKCLQVLRMFAGYGVHITAINREGQTLLYLALRSMCNWGARLIANLDANIDTVLESGKTMLSVAVERCNIKIVALLLRHGANVNPVLAWKFAPLYIAASRGYLRIARLLVERGERGEAMVAQSPLIAAAENGHLEILRLFWKYNVNEVLDSSTNGPLFAAAKNGHACVMEFLIECGADLTKNLDDYECMADAQSEVGRLLLSYFDEESQVEILGLNYEELSRAAVYGTKELAEEYLIDTTDNGDVSLELIHSLSVLWAAYMNHEAVVGILLDHLTRTGRFAVKSDDEMSDDTDDEVPCCEGTTDGDGMTPLHIAAQRNYIKVAETALAHGLDVDAQDGHARTPLFIAAERGHADMVGYLLSHRADMSIPALKGYTPIRIAVLRGHFAVVELLLNHAADINEVGMYRDCEGEMEVESKYDYEYVYVGHGRSRRRREKKTHRSYYVSKNDEAVNVDTRTDEDDCYIGLNGESLLHLAVLMNHGEVVNLLLTRGALEVDKTGKSLFDIATKHESYNAMEVLRKHGICEQGQTATENCRQSGLPIEEWVYLEEHEVSSSESEDDYVEVNSADETKGSPEYPIDSATTVGMGSKRAEEPGAFQKLIQVKKRRFNARDGA